MGGNWAKPPQFHSSRLWLGERVSPGQGRASGLEAAGKGPGGGWKRLEKALDAVGKGWKRPWKGDPDFRTCAPSPSSQIIPQQKFGWGGLGVFFSLYEVLIHTCASQNLQNPTPPYFSLFFPPDIVHF